MLNLVLLAVLLGVFALLYADGLWSNTIHLFNAILAGLITTSYFEPLAAALTSWVPFFFVHWDILAFGFLFAGIYSLLRVIAAQLSKYRVRFHPILDTAGSIVAALLTGWIGVCLVCFALHLAPLSRVFMFDSFRPEEMRFFGTAPDRLWLGFAQRMSLGALAAGEDRVFDPQSEFMLKYATRRAWFEKQDTGFPK